MVKLIFVNETKFSVDKTPFVQLLKRLRALEGPFKYTQLELLLTDNENIQRLNKMYRHKDQPTDVLSFSLDDDENLGQLVISVERAEEQAKELSQSLEEELRFLFTHGLLHLLGYDHEEPEEEKIMLQKSYALLGRK